jgi:hypothetical protein
MRQTRGHLDLAQEPLAAERRREIGVECFKRDIAAVLDVPREVHRRHAASAELALDAVAVSERAAESGIRWSSD